MATFAERLKELRKNKGDTQKSMADLLGITERNYQRYEYGLVDPIASNIAILADHFNVSIDYLLGRTDYWMDADGNIHTKIPPDFLNMGTAAEKDKPND